MIEQLFQRAKQLWQGFCIFSDKVDMYKLYTGSGQLFDINLREIKQLKKPPQPISFLLLQYGADQVSAAVIFNGMLTCFVIGNHPQTKVTFYQQMLSPFLDELNRVIPAWSQLQEENESFMFLWLIYFFLLDRNFQMAAIENKPQYAPLLESIDRGDYSKMQLYIPIIKERLKQLDYYKITNKFSPSFVFKRQLLRLPLYEGSVPHKPRQKEAEEFEASQLQVEVVAKRYNLTIFKKQISRIQEGEYSKEVTALLLCYIQERLNSASLGFFYINSQAKVKNMCPPQILYHKSYSKYLIIMEGGDYAQIMSVDTQARQLKWKVLGKEPTKSQIKPLLNNLLSIDFTKSMTQEFVPSVQQKLCPVVIAAVIELLGFWKSIWMNQHYFREKVVLLIQLMGKTRDGRGEIQFLFEMDVI